MKEKAKIAVVGAGWWATYTHIPALQMHPGVEEIILCDSNAARLDAAAETYQIAKSYADLAMMLANEQLDGAIIATNHASHYALARLCLEHGLHVMIEKPMTLYARDARELVELALEQDRQIIIGYPYHFTAHVRRVREVIQSGELGAIQLVNCFMASNILNLLRGDDGSSRGARYAVHGPGDVYAQPHLSGGGQGHLQITHSAGLMFYVTGLRPRRVHALMHRHGLPLDLVDAMLVEFADGPLGVVSGTGNQGSAAGGMVDLQVYCEHGSVDINIITGSAHIHRRDGASETIQVPDGERYPRFATAQNLVDVALGRAANGSPVEAGWRTVELLDAAYHSAAKNGQAVFIEQLYVLPG
jgi:predicted dehydrogenase